MKKITLFIAALVMSVMSYALNPFAYALSSSLSEDGATLTVNYSLNAEATAVSVVVLDGEEVVKTVPCEGLAAGEYTVEVPTEGLPAGKDLTWKVEVQGTSVEVPTQHETLYSLYHPSSVDIDNNPENATFGLILANEAMHKVKHVDGYLSTGFGAGIYAFNPAFEPITNGDQPGFNGGNEFVETNSTGTSYAPRRIRISDDGRIFVTSLDVNGTYLWELNPENLNEWTPVFTDTQMNDLAELVDAEGNFVAGPNAGFDVRGEGENLQLLMLSGNTKAFAFAPNGFKCAEYNLGTATSWTGAPTRIIWDSIYALVPTQSQVQYDAEGGVWFAQYRGTTTDDQPGMVHWTAEGVEDFKWLRDMTRNAGIRYDGEFAKMIVAGNNGAAKKATLYTVTKDEEGKPVFTEELVIDMAVVGNNLNDFAFDYAGNLYALGHSAEKIVAWAMPYSGLVATPAASQYTFQVAGSNPDIEWIEMPLEITNLTTSEIPVGDQIVLQLMGRDDMNDADVMLFLNNYTGEEKAYEVNAESSLMTFGGLELTVMDGSLTKSIDPELGDVYAGVVHASVEDDGMAMYVAFDLKMYALPPVEIEIEDVTITIDEESAIAIFAADWEGTPLQVEVSGFENAEFMEYEECWLSIGDDNVWVDAAAGPVAVIIEDGLAMLEGEFTSYATGKSYYVTLTGNMPGAVEPVEMVGVVKRALQYYDATIVLTHEADGTAHIYNVVDGVVAEVSQEGVIARDPENAGDLLAISDIALTEDGKLVAVNYMVCQAGDDYIDEGYKKGENRFYIWNSLDEAPSVWFKSNMYANWFRSNNGYTMAVKGTSTNASIALSGYHATQTWARIATYKVIDGVYTEPADAATGNDNYTWCEGPADGAIDGSVIGAVYELNASPLAAENWIVDGNLVDPIEYVAPADIKAIISTLTPLSADLGKKYNGTSIVTVGEQVLMVAPYATAEGLLAGVKVLDITAGLAAAVEVNVLDLDAPVEATAAATAVQVVENGLNINLVADATIYPLTTVAEGPEYMVIEDNVTNLIIDLESMAIIGGPSTMWQVEVFLGIGEEDGNGNFALTEESSVAIMGFDARFIDGYAYDIDVNAPAAKVVLHVEDSGFFYEIRLDMTSAAPADPIAVVVENATVTIDTIPLFGDAVDYALTMTADWTYAEDGVTYPVLVEVPVYYPEATEPSEMTCTVTIGGMGDTDPWLGFGEGTLTITTVDGVVTAKGLVSNPYTGVAFDVTVSGKLPQGPGTGLDNVQVEVKALKTIKNGQLIIVRDGKEFNAQGAVVK